MAGYITVAHVGAMQEQTMEKNLAMHSSMKVVYP